MDLDTQFILDTLEKIDTPADISVLPLLPVKDMVVFPHTVVPVLVGRNSSLKAVADAMAKYKYLLLVPQKEYTDDFETPQVKDLHRVGTLVSISQIIRLPGNLIKILVQGLEFVRITRINFKDGGFTAKYNKVEIGNINENTLKFKALMKNTLSLFENYIKLNEELPSEIMNNINQVEGPERKFYLMCSNIDTSFENKLTLLQQVEVQEMLMKLSEIITYESEILKFRMQIDSDVNEKVAQIQKKYLLREQIRILQEELGEGVDDFESTEELEILKKKIKDAKMPEQAEEKAMEIFNKLRKIPNISPDYAVESNYIDFLIQLPWNNASEDNLNLQEVKKILDEDHYDLEKPKDRILDFIAILNFTKDIKRQIICFVGPPVKLH